ncbi:MAG: N-methylhydantoinase [Thermoleophilaceae bacterium]|nr:N-methylhydantoinase [Thermoleophilaceae bacterium]
MTTTEELTVTHGDSRAVSRTDSATATADADPVTTEVIRYGLQAAADQMRLTLIRGAFSPVIYDVQDLAVTLYDDKLRLLAQGSAQPLFMGALGYVLEAILDRLGGADTLDEGDIVFSTYGYDLGSHQQDAAVIAPVFHEGELVGYAVTKAHHLDIGAKDPYCTDTTDIHQEGVIFPSVKLYRRGERQDDLYRTLLANSRLPTFLAGDLNAQIGAAQVGLKQLLRLIERFGLDTFRQAVERMFDHGEAVMRAFLETVPDGRYVANGIMDNNGVDTDEIPMEVAAEIVGDRVIVDLTATAPEQRGPMNCPWPTSVAGARIALMSFAVGGQAGDGDHFKGSLNEGHFRAIEVRTKPGTQFHPRPPAPIFMYAWPVFTLIDLLHKALSEALPDALPAAGGGDCCFALWWGLYDDGTAWADAACHPIGMGASARGDSVNPLIHMACSGVKSAPAETTESRRPLVLEKFEFVPDSGGNGRFRGGPAVEYHYRTLRDCFMTLAWDRTRTPPWGIHGGGDALPNRCRVRHADGTVETYEKATGLALKAGSVVELRCGGGGGYGPPEERDPEAVRRDIEDGYVTEGALQEA